MFYDKIKNIIEEMIDDIYAGKEECSEVISFNLIRDQNVPITIEAKMLYPLSKVKITFRCAFLLVDPSVTFEEIYQKDEVEDEIRMLRLVARFTTLLEKLRKWVEVEAPDMVKWGEGVIFDKNGRTKKIPFPIIPTLSDNKRKMR